MKIRVVSLLCAAVWVACLLVGSVVDPSPSRSHERRGDRRVLEADFHAHTRFSDGFLSPMGLVIQARRRELDVIAVTEHNILFPARIARWFSGLVGGPPVMLGEEVTTRHYHLLALGIERPVDASAPLRQVIDDVHAQGGIVAAAHPVRRFWPALVPVRGDLDATEVMHPSAYRAARDGWSWEDMRRYHDDAAAEGKRLTALGTSDYHFMSPMGICRTLVFAESDDPAAVLAALRAGHTVVYDLEGRAYGDPDLVAELTRQPYLRREVSYDYRPTGAVDRVARIAGWLALLGLLLAGRLRPRGSSSAHREVSADCHRDEGDRREHQEEAR